MGDISSLWLRFADHIFRQKNTAGLLTSISVGDMNVETMVGDFTHHGDKNLRSQTKYSSMKEKNVFSLSSSMRLCFITIALWGFFPCGR